ncbi:MAG: hypothetical protein KC636_30495, partial [Myxococcales bacterium]|nr:hypothetical protein [Myxococcales bacterium]
MPGQETGHTGEAPPGDLPWSAYIAHFRERCGGWAALADELIRRAAGVVEVPSDPGSVEKGLRRLAQREHKPGRDYGRWMLRFFGVPPDAERWARWIAQYHSRFADLPSSLRLAQLRRWDQPPASESRLAAWIDVGVASVLSRQGDDAGCRQRLERAASGAAHAGPACELEVMLFSAFFATNEGRRDRSEALFDACDARLADPALSREDRLCYRARLLVQRAYHRTKPLRGESADLLGAVALFEQIETDDELPFVCFRRAAGLAYCHWQLGDVDRGVALARAAARHAGDGGLVRFRVMALNLLSRMAPEP